MSFQYNFYKGKYFARSMNSYKQSSGESFEAYEKVAVHLKLILRKLRFIFMVGRVHAATEEHLEAYAREGLRTLCIAKKVIKLRVTLLFWLIFLYVLLSSLKCDQFRNFCSWLSKVHILKFIVNQKPMNIAFEINFMC